ncbi:hypothetical protein [Paraburkholderia phosphatilytica]|uniref:hypothetical protein n=1 Tax=Paraburkholderia phosphatilytica TaxID=2282883 RepID=UPI000E470ED1|nr:hypothetical protein [Paraburkholderia phosphatilytica]
MAESKTKSESDSWQFQLRMTLAPELAEQLRRDPAGGAHQALAEVLRRHRATLQCQYDAFAAYVSKAEQLGPDAYPLYHWTRATIDDPQKQAKYLRAFTVYVDGAEVYPAELAGPLEAELRALVGGDIEQVTKYDTNPANNPQPPKGLQ